MPRTLCRLLSALVLMAAALYLPALASAAEVKPYIVILEPTSAAGARVAAQDLASDEHFTNSQVYDDSLKGFAAKLDAHDLGEVRDDPRVKAVVPDKPVQMAGLVPLTAGDNIPLGVRRVGAATTSTVHEASTANVAVIDTGIDLSHPDLNAVAGRNCVGSGAPNDDNGHGTHVAGTIGARNQGGGGAVGVAPGTKLWAVKVLNSGGSGYTSQIICGIDWVTSTRTDANASNDIAVVNMSLGGGMAPNTSCGRSVNDAEHIAICNSIAAGVTYVVAAGNSGVDFQNFAPANYPEALTVTAVGDTDGAAGGLGPRDGCYGNGDDTPASFSNFATRAVDVAHAIAAPGVCIRSTYLGSRYATMSGTSMASPHVAGLVALCMGENGAHGPCWGKPVDEVRSIMIAAATTTAGANPDLAFSGAPSRNVAGRYYGHMASTAFPSAAGVTPAATAAPAITGSAATGQTLTASTGTWSGAGVSTSQQWLRCTAATGLTSCSAIAGATGTTYQLTSADTGRYLHVRVVATNGEGSAIAISPATAAVAQPVAPAATAAPAIAGIAQLTHTLTARNGTWTGTAPITYATQWQRCTSTTLATCTDISGATATGYAPVSADVGKYLRVAITATNLRGAVTARSAAVLVSAPPALAATATPVLLGVAVVGHTMTVRGATWNVSVASSAYQWQRCTNATTLASCSDIAGATAGAYLVTAADRGKYLRVAVTGTNAANASQTAVARSAATGAVTG
jgi:subtilisin family serine protease